MRGWPSSRTLAIVLAMSVAIHAMGWWIVQRELAPSTRESAIASKEQDLSRQLGMRSQIETGVATPPVPPEPQPKPEPEPEPEPELEPEPEQEEQAVAEPKSDAAPAPEPEPSAESAPQPASKAIEGADKTIDSDWLAQLKAHLSAHVYYPQQAKWRGQEGKVVVSMHISGEGRVKDYKIIRSSGVAALDAAVTEMLERAGPFPEPPADQSTRRSQQVSVPIIFSLQN